MGLIRIYSWKQFMGECTKDTAFGMLDYFFENGEEPSMIKTSQQN